MLTMVISFIVNNNTLPYLRKLNENERKVYIEKIAKKAMLVKQKFIPYLYNKYDTRLNYYLKDDISCSNHIFYLFAASSIDWSIVNCCFRLIVSCSLNVAREVFNCSIWLWRSALLICSVAIASSASILQPSLLIST